VAVRHLRFDACSNPGCPTAGRLVSMAVQLICPNLRCRKYLSVGDEHRGKLVKCQNCNTDFRVPEVRKPVAAAATPPARSAA
jgi:hypothetical protein